MGVPQNSSRLFAIFVSLVCTSAERSTTATSFSDPASRWFHNVDKWKADFDSNVDKLQGKVQGELNDDALNAIHLSEEYAEHPKIIDKSLQGVRKMAAHMAEVTHKDQQEQMELVERELAKAVPAKPHVPASFPVHKPGSNAEEDEVPEDWEALTDENKRLKKELKELKGESSKPASDVAAVASQGPEDASIKEVANDVSASAEKPDVAGDASPMTAAEADAGVSAAAEDQGADQKSSQKFEEIAAAIEHQDPAQQDQVVDQKSSQKIEETADAAENQSSVQEEQAADEASSQKFEEMAAADEHQNPAQEDQAADQKSSEKIEETADAAENQSPVQEEQAADEAPISDEAASAEDAAYAQSHSSPGTEQNAEEGEAVQNSENANEPEKGSLIQKQVKSHQRH